MSEAADFIDRCLGADEDCYTDVSCLQVRYVRWETEKAWWLCIEDEMLFGVVAIRVWVPKSIAIYEGDYFGGRVYVPGWFYDQIFEGYDCGEKDNQGLELE